MNDVLTLLATATDERLWRFRDMVDWCSTTPRQLKLTIRFYADEQHLPLLIDAATACAVTLQVVHEPGRDETYETLWQGPMEGWPGQPD